MLAIKTAQRALPADTRKSVIYLIVAVVVIAIAVGAGISYYLFAR
jgi:flagellar basal body-associated protein FliL